MEAAAQHHDQFLPINFSKPPCTEEPYKPKKYQNLIPTLNLEKIEAVNFSEDDEAENIEERSPKYGQFQTYHTTQSAAEALFNSGGHFSQQLKIANNKIE